MLNLFVSRLSQIIYQKNCIDDVYKMQQIEYALSAIILFALNSISYLIISMLSGRFLESLIMLSCFLVFRTSNAGYHSKTPLGCYLLGIIIWSIGMLLSTIISSIMIYVLGYFLSLLVFVLINNNPRKRTFERDDLRNILILYSLNTITILILSSVKSGYTSYAATGSFLSISAIILNPVLSPSKPEQS